LCVCLLLSESPICRFIYLQLPGAAHWTSSLSGTLTLCLLLLLLLLQLHQAQRMQAGYQMPGAAQAAGGMGMQNLAMNPALAAQVAAQGQAGLQMQKANSGQLQQMAGMPGGEGLL
jgi:hypothetical protein